VGGDFVFCFVLAAIKPPQFPKRRNIKVLRRALDRVLGFVLPKRTEQSGVASRRFTSLHLM